MNVFVYILYEQICECFIVFIVYILELAYHKFKLKCKCYWYNLALWLDINQTICICESCSINICCQYIKMMFSFLSNKQTPHQYALDCLVRRWHVLYIWSTFFLFVSYFIYKRPKNSGCFIYLSKKKTELVWSIKDSYTF